MNLAVKLCKAEKWAVVKRGAGRWPAGKAQVGTAMDIKKGLLAKRCSPFQAMIQVQAPMIPPSSRCTTMMVERGLELPPAGKWDGARSSPGCWTPINTVR